MEALVALLLLVLGAIWLAPLGVGLAAVAAQRRRITALEERLLDLELASVAQKQRPTQAAAAPAAAPAAPEPELQAPPATDEPAPPTEAAPELEASAAPEPEPAAPPPEAPLPPSTPPAPLPRPPAWQPPSPERVVVWFAAGLGGVAVVLTALLALVAAVERGWILPSLRVSGALVAGTVLWVAGSALRSRAHPWVGSALAGAGAGVSYGGLWAGTALYHLLPNSVGSAGMVAVTLVATLQAARLDDRVLAWLGLIGGLLTPVLVSTGQNAPVPFFAYLTLLAAGLVAASVHRRWPDVILGAAVGVGALHAGWAASWFAADQAIFALGGALALSLPFAAAAARKDRMVHWTGAVGAVGLTLLAVPWLGPIDALFMDPRNSLWVTREAPQAGWVAAAFTALLPAPLWLAGRRRGHALGGLAGTITALSLTLAFATTWAGATEVPAAAIALGAVGSLAMSVLLTARHPASSQGTAPMPVIAGLALTIGAGSGSATGATFALAACAIPALGLLAARSARSGWLLPGTLLGAALPLELAAFDPERVGLRWIVTPALVTIALLSQLPLLMRWERGDRAPLATSALAGLALLPPLYAVWDAGWGPTVVGVLPLLLAADTLLATGVLVRTRRVGRDDWILGLFVGVVLFGVSSALPLQLQERWLTVAWALEVAALAVVSRRITHPLVRVAAVVLAGVVGVRLLFNPYALAWGQADGWPILNWTLYAWGVPLVCLLVAARAWPREVEAPKGELWKLAEQALAWAPSFFSSLAVLVGFALVNVQVSDAFQDAGPIELGGHSLFEGMVRSVSWAAYGLLILGIGAWRDHRAVRFAGFAFVLLSAVKVFAVDLWGLSGFARVGSVGGLAVTLLVAAFLFERLVRGGARPVESR